jgi:hypothetical protein
MPTCVVASANDLGETAAAYADAGPPDAGCGQRLVHLIAGRLDAEQLERLSQWFSGGAQAGGSDYVGRQREPAHQRFDFFLSTQQQVVETQIA